MWEFSKFIAHWSDGWMAPKICNSYGSSLVRLGLWLWSQCWSQVDGVRTELTCRTVVPKLVWHQGSVSWKKMFPTTGVSEGWLQDDSSTLHLLCHHWPDGRWSAGSNTSDGEGCKCRWSFATCVMLTSCYEAQLLTSHRPVMVYSPEAGYPCCRTRSWSWGLVVVSIAQVIQPLT